MVGDVTLVFVSYEPGQAVTRGKSVNRPCAVPRPFVDNRQGVSREFFQLHYSRERKPLRITGTANASNAFRFDDLQRNAELSL